MISRASDVVEHGSGLNKGNSEAIHRFLTSKTSSLEILERMALWHRWPARHFLDLLEGATNPSIASLG